MRPRQIEGFTDRWKASRSALEGTGRFRLRGPARATAKSGYKYYGSHLDDNSDLAVVFLQKTKTEETLAHYKAFEAEMKMQHRVNSKVWGTNRGREYTCGLFDKHLASKVRNANSPRTTPPSSTALPSA
jgi:hypothetical protein